MHQNKQLWIVYRQAHSVADCYHVRIVNTVLLLLWLVSIKVVHILREFLLLDNVFANMEWDLCV